MTELIGRTIGRYQIVSRVGRGGMARVYKAYQASLDRNVAIKVLHGHLAEEPDFVERFEREATAVARLRHPNIVQVYDYDVTDGLYYIVMEFVEGPTLKAEISERLKRQTDGQQELFNLDEIARLIATLADAIDYAHSQGMIHRDLKPGNVMFTTDGQVRLTDFGLARMVYTSQQSKTGALSGTPAYMAPEQVHGGHVDERCDIYSLGIMVYELFTGRVPFLADTPYAIMTMHVTDEVPPMRQINPSIPADVETVVMTALNKDSALRQQNAGALADALQEAIGVFVVQASTGGVVAPIATLADSQEMMPVSTHVGLSASGLLSVTSPYRGLYAFREEDAPFFFGREAFTEKLALTLREKSMAAVIGPSGSGKSSVVYAGLLPKLREEHQWRIIQMRPGSLPFNSLAGALVDQLQPELGETKRLIEVKELAAAIQASDIKLAEVLSRLVEKNNSDKRQLLVVDQFEELYTLCTDAGIRRQFPNVLFEALGESQLREDIDFSLILTLRADFMGQALANRPFADALQDADVKLGPMTQAELARAIESPAAKKRIVYEAGLVDRILDDVGDEPGNLPLLEFALTLLWERRAGRRLTHASYEAIGRVEGSLARYADEIYEQLASDEQERAKRVFTQMVRPGEGTEDTRRLATYQELGENDWSLAQRLADARLVVTGRTPDGHETVEVVHEALIRGWGRLREWMNAERVFRSWQERLRVSLHQWDVNQQDEGTLLRGAPLAEAEEWLKRKPADLSQQEQAYIQASIDQREKRAAEREAQRQRELEAAKELAEEQQRRAEAEFQRAEEQARSSRRLRILAAVLAVVFLIAVVAAIFAIGESRDAERQADARATEVVVRTTAESVAKDNAKLAATRAAESASAKETAEGERARANTAAEFAIESKEEAEIERDRADAQARLALARQLAAQSATLLGPQLDLALLLSLEANKIQDTPETVGSILASLQANPNLVIYLRGHPSLLQSVDYSPDGLFLATAGAEGLVLLWDVASGEITKEFVGHDPTQLVNRVVFSPDGSLLATASDDQTVKLWDVKTGEILKELAGHSAWAQSVEFSPDGTKLVTGSGDRSAIVWDIKSGERLLTLAGHSGALWDAVFSNKGDLIATASADGNAIIWDAETGQPIHTINAHNGLVYNVDFDPEDQILVSGGSDLNLTLWDVMTGEQIGDPLTGHAAGVVDVEFSPDGRIIASSSGDSTVRLWDVTSRQQIQLFANHDGLVPSVTFNRDGNMLASGDATGTAIIWDITPGTQSLGRVITGHIGGVNQVDFDPTGKALASGGADSTIRFWDITNGIETSEPITHGLRSGEPITALDFSSDGQLLASGSRNGTIQFWEVSSGEPYTGAISALTNGVSSLAISPDRQLLYSGGQTGFSALWDMTTGNQVGGGFLSGHTDQVNVVSFSPDGQLLASGGEEGAVIIRSLSEVLTGQVAGAPVTPLTYTVPISVSIQSLAFNPESDRLLTGDSDGRVILWDVTTRQALSQTLINAGSPVFALAVRPDTGEVIVGDAKGDIVQLKPNLTDLKEPQFENVGAAISDLSISEDGRQLRSLTSGGEITFFDIDTGRITAKTQLAIEGDASKLALSSDGRLASIGLQNADIVLYDALPGPSDGRILVHEAPFLGNVNAVAYSPNGHVLATAGADGSIVLWDADTHDPILGPILGHNAIVVSLAFSPDGQLLASGSCSQFHSSGNCVQGEVILWDVATGQSLHTFTGTVGFTQALDFSQDGKTLVVNDCTRVEVAGVCIEGALRFWDVTNGVLLDRQLEGHTGFIWSVKFSPDGKLLASGSNDNNIILWQVDTGQRVGQRLSNHGGPVRRLAFSPDGKKLASAGFDNLIFLWDVESGQALGGPLVTYTNIGMDVVFSPDGTILASSSIDGSITLSDVDLESWKEKACHIANRNMWLEEWQLFFGDTPYRATCPDE